MAETARTVCTDALVEIGAWMAGQTPNDSEITYAFRKLNLILDDWTAQYGYFAYGRVQQRFTLTPTQGIYTMGPGALFPDFAMPRPEGSQPGKGILSAWLVVGAGTNEVWYPIGVYSPEEFIGITQPNYPTDYPWALVNDGAYPLSNITFYGIPNAAYDVVFLVPNQISQFAALDDAFAMPPAYQNALMLTTAEATAAGIRRDDMQLEAPPKLVMRAAAARQALVSLNNTSQRVRAPGLLGPRRAGNWAGTSDLAAFRAGAGLYGGWGW